MTKQEILDKFNDINFVYNDSSKHDTLSRMLDELLKEQEIVRCKDCKHGDICKDETGKDIVECFKQYKTRKLNWYCADGERAENARCKERR